jgi:hypothetical protein
MSRMAFGHTKRRPAPPKQIASKCAWPGPDRPKGNRPRLEPCTLALPSPPKQCWAIPSLILRHPLLKAARPLFPAIRFSGLVHAYASTLD